MENFVNLACADPFIYLLFYFRDKVHNSLFFISRLIQVFLHSNEVALGQGCLIELGMTFEVYFTLTGRLFLCESFKLYREGPFLYHLKFVNLILIKNIKEKRKVKMDAANEYREAQRQFMQQY